MIPKVIHYIWVGKNPLPKIAEKCIESWRRYCPDYEIKKWDESNLDLEFCDYVKEAYSAKKYAFVSDVLRTKIIFDEGGIYLDIDVELFKSLDPLLENKCFYGFESDWLIAPGLIMGAEPGDIHLKNILNLYMKKHFFEKNKMDLTTVCEIYTDYYSKLGLSRNGKTQQIDDILFYSTEYFCPKDYVSGKIKKTNNTYTIHHYYASWQPRKMKMKDKIKRIIRNILGEKIIEKVKRKKRKFD